MTEPARRPRPVAVPASRLARVGRLGTMTAGIASGAAVKGMRRVASGERLGWRDLLLTPANLTRVADELARMRGAAMKVGQLISMDAGDVLPPELADIMARLRSNADFMPGHQLKTVLSAEWSADWRRHFERFEVRPIAAASIGQVHRATRAGGEALAVKIQYPGIRRSIDSDVENVAALARVAGLVPRGLDLEPLLAEAKRQLHEEADYEREGAELSRFGRLLKDDNAFVLPRLAQDLTTPNILTMSYLPGRPIEALIDQGQDERNRVIQHLLRLVFRELFEFGRMQSDPNFANYRYDTGTGRIGLLDFGASRPVARSVAEGYCALFRAGMDGTTSDIAAAALALGLFAPGTLDHHKQMVTEMIALAFAPLRSPGAYDFGATEHAEALRDHGLAMAADRSFLHVPPMDVLYVQRKLGGLYLLGRRAEARVDIRALLAPYL